MSYITLILMRGNILSLIPSLLFLFFFQAQSMNINNWFPPTLHLAENSLPPELGIRAQEAKPTAS